MVQTTPTWIVTKFGGNSVADRHCWQTITEIVQKHVAAGYKPLIVCSALGGISNALVALLDLAERENPATALSEIRSKHEALCRDLEISPAVFNEKFEALEKIIQGIHLLGDASPRARAQVMAFGERLLTDIGVAYLKQQGMKVALYDSGDLLKALPDDPRYPERHYLLARCDDDVDPLLLKKLNSDPADVLLTQGFIASNELDETVLLGRGGSDTSAAYYAAKLQAVRCEIWTDVPGIYSANPRVIPEARLLKSLDYDEAQEIASMGGKVLHPLCIGPVKRHQIELFVGYTRKPSGPGTIVSPDGRHSGIQIKSIQIKYGLSILSIETVRMWQQVGFLAEVFACIKQHGISIDLISTSESNVTVSLDPSVTAQDPKNIDGLLQDLNQFAKATLIQNTAAISLVGHNIRGVIHRLGDALKVFQEQKIHLISQAANDLNLTFVVDESQAERLARRLHAVLIEQNANHDFFLQSWQETESTPKMLTAPWWQIERDTLIDLAKKQSPVYVYNEARLKTSIDELKQMTAIDRLFYSVKANYHENILQHFYEAGLGFECVSLNEIEYLFRLFPKLDPKRIVFTPNFAPRNEYERALALGVYVTLDNLHPLEQWGDLFKGREILIRLDPGQGHGHHHHVCTAGAESKFGIAVSELPKLYECIEKTGCHVIGLHVHVGSGILSPEPWRNTALFLSEILPHFKEVRIFNLGGGLGVVEKPTQEALDLKTLNEYLLEIKQLHPHIEFWLEPGRYLVAASAVLLAKVTQIKKKGEITFVGIETGMNSLIRPSLYGAYHDIVNLSQFGQPKVQMVNIVGPICESGDVLGFSRLFETTREGDVILIANAGAYGRCMSSHYNLREPASEFFITEKIS